MALASLAVFAWDLTDRGVPVVGQLPRGLPAPTWPAIDAADFAELFVAALGVAFISFADTAVLSRTFAMKNGSAVDANRELAALGAVNVATGVFQGFPVTSSQSRTPVAHDAGAVTQITGVVGALMVALVVIVSPDVFGYLPDAALAAVVIAAVSRLVEVKGLTVLWAARRSEFVLALAAFVAVALSGPIVGTGIAIALSLLNFMRKAWRPHTAELVRVAGLKGYHDADRHPEGARIPGLLLYRFDAPLFFANGGFLEEDLLRRVDTASTPVRWVVITAEPITDVDSTAADELHELLSRLDERGVHLAFAELKGHVRDRLVPYGLVGRIGEDRFYRTVGQAVHAYVRETETPWRDWDDGAAANPDNRGTPPA
jgi:MFS superfamily sulfate permease-like transporter